MSAKEQTVRLRYDNETALYASQFVLNLSEDEIILNFSSGILPDNKSGENYLPIHSRIAISKLGARKLAALLNQVLSTENDNSSAPIGSKPN
jgi:hypothetical protein